VYEVQNSAALARLRRAVLRARRGGRPLVTRTVVLIGLTSLFTDISSEMVAAVLPLYLVTIRGLDPVQFGVIDGIYQGGSALVRIAFGFVADRLRRYRDVAAFGYGISAFSKLGLIAAGSSWGAVTATVLADRTGKGVRTAPRDALISMSSAKESLGVSFGVHRALDTLGAMIGPIIAFALLALAPDAFNELFLVSFCFALIGLAILLLLVEEPPHPKAAPAAGPDAPAAVPPPAETPAAGDGRKVSVKDAGRLAATPGFGGLLAVSALLGLVTISDAFIYLELEREIDFDASLFPLLYVGTAAVFMTLAVPIGRLADRVGRMRVFLGGYALLLLLYAELQLGPATGAAVPIALATLGLFYAATDGVLAALGSAMTPERMRGTGLAMLGTATGLSRFGASLAFGALWSFAGVETALLVFTIALAVALIISAAILLRPAARTA
jgi:MFS family permease